MKNISGLACYRFVSIKIVTNQKSENSAYKERNVINREFESIEAKLTLVTKAFHEKFLFDQQTFLISKIIN
jgi:hypothetical protein